MVCVAAIAVPLLAACSSLSDELHQRLSNELEIRGFTDIEVDDVAANTTGTEYATYFATASDCRVVLNYSNQRLPGERWLLLEQSSKGEEYDVVLPNPTAEKIGELEAFNYCYEDDTQSSPAEE